MNGTALFPNKEMTAAMSAVRSAPKQVAGSEEEGARGFTTGSSGTCRCQGPVVGKGWDVEDSKEVWKGYHCTWGVGRVAQDRVA